MGMKFLVCIGGCPCIGGFFCSCIGGCSCFGGSPCFGVCSCFVPSTGCCSCIDEVAALDTAGSGCTTAGCWAARREDAALEPAGTTLGTGTPKDGICTELVLSRTGISKIGFPSALIGISMGPESWVLSSSMGKMRGIRFGSRLLAEFCAPALETREVSFGLVQIVERPLGGTDPKQLHAYKVCIESYDAQR